MDERAKFGHKPPGWDSWGYPNASRYIRKFQSRRSLLIWKLHGERLDGFTNEDHPSEDKPGSGKLVHKGQEIDLQKNRDKFDVDYTSANARVRRQTDCRLRPPHRRPLDRPRLPDRSRLRPNEPRETRLRLDARRPATDINPELSATRWQAEFARIVIGMHDYGTGLNPASFRVVADFELEGVPPGENLAAKFESTTQGVWELKLAKPIPELKAGRLIVSVEDKQGNAMRIERHFSIKK